MSRHGRSEETTLRPHASDPMSGIFNDMINTDYDLSPLITLLVGNKAV